MSTRAANYVIVVLGYHVQPDGRPTPLLAERIRRAAQYYHQVKRAGANAVVIPNGGAVANTHAEATVMAGCLNRDHAVPEVDIVAETEARSTFGNAVCVCKLMATHERLVDLDRLRFVLVTSEFHAARGAMFLAAVLRSPGAAQVAKRLDRLACMTELAAPIGPVASRLTSAHCHAAGVDNARAALFPLWEAVDAEDFMSEHESAASDQMELRGITAQCPLAAAWDGKVSAPPPTLAAVIAAPSNASSSN